MDNSACFVCGRSFTSVEPIVRVPLGTRRLCFVHPARCLDELEFALNEWGRQWEKDHPVCYPEQAEAEARNAREGR